MQAGSSRHIEVERRAGAPALSWRLAMPCGPETRAAEFGHATSNTKSKTTALRVSSVEVTRSSGITDATGASSRDARRLRSIEQRVERVHRFAQPARKRLCEPAMQDDGYHGVVGLYPRDLLA